MLEIQSHAFKDFLWYPSRAFLEARMARRVRKSIKENIKLRKKSMPFFEKKIVLGLFIISIVFLLGSALYHFFILSHAKSENPKDEMKKLPQEVKEKVEQQGSKATFRVPVLMYHYVEYVKDKKDKTRALLNIEPHIFDAQVKTLKEANYTFITASDLGDILDGTKKLPKNPIVLTFDDGHWDLYTDILPILKKYNVHATAYICPGLIGQPDFLSQEQLDKVVQSGLIELGDHTMHHISLKGTTSLFTTYEIFEAKETLERRYKRKIVSFAYPYGAFDESVVEIVKSAGFKTAMSTIPAVEQAGVNRFFVYRIRPGQRVGEELLTYLKQDTFKPY